MLALLLAVRSGMLPGRVFRVVAGMESVCMGHVRVMRRLLMIAGFVMLRRLAVVV